METLVNCYIRTVAIAALSVFLAIPIWAADRCTQFNLILPAELGGTPTQKVEVGLDKDGKPLLVKSLRCEFTTSKGRISLNIQNDANSDRVATQGRVLSMSNNSRPPQKLAGVGDEALYSRSNSVMRLGTTLYLTGWKWADRRSNVDLTPEQIKAVLTAVLAAAPAGGPKF